LPPHQERQELELYVAGKFRCHSLHRSQISKDL
jgi:hypothetical protein